MVKGLTSVLIVNFKAAEILRDCLHSIATQGVALEVIVVDNNSGDRDRDILLSLGRSYPFLRLIFNNDNAGFSKANNQALAVSRGEYILFLNPDTILFPSCLELLVSFFRTVYGVGAVIPKLWMDEKKSFLMPPSYLPSLWDSAQASLYASSEFLSGVFFNRWLKKALRYWNTDSPLQVDAISGAFFMTTRQVLDTVGSFDERFPLYFEDSDLCKRIKKAGLILYYCPLAEAVHLYNQSAKSSQESLQKFLASETLYMEKYYPPYLIKMVTRLAKFPKAKDRHALKKWDFSSPIRAVPGGFLLFSSLRTLMPSVFHRMTNEQFAFDDDFVRNLAGGLYYAVLFTPDSTISERFILKKN